MATIQEAIAAFGPDFARLPQDVQQAALQNFDLARSSLGGGSWTPADLVRARMGFAPQGSQQGATLPSGYGMLTGLNLSNPNVTSGHYFSDPNQVRWDPNFGFIGPTWQANQGAWTDLGYPDEWQLTDPGVAGAIAAGGYGFATGLNALLGPGLAGGAGAAAAGAVPAWAPATAGTTFSVGAIGPAELSSLLAQEFMLPEIQALGAGVSGLGALPGAGLYSGTGSATAAGGTGAGAAGTAEIAGPPSWLSPNSNWLADLGPASNLGGTFSTDMPWYAQLAEGQSLANQGFYPWESMSLGASPGGSLGGAALNYAQNYFSNPLGLGKGSGGGTMGWLDTLLNVGGNLLGGYLQSNAAKNASQAQVDASNAANATTLAMYNQNRADLAPWRVAGVNALANLSAGLPNWQTDPGYQFRRNEGIKGIERSAAARGLLGSGSTLKDLTRWNQDLASTEFGNAWNRQAGLAGIGQTAVNTGVNAGQNAASQVAANQIGAGNARASGYVGQNNAWTGALGNALNWYNQNQALGQIPGLLSSYGYGG